jgi:hypothetical protein
VEQNVAKLREVPIHHVTTRNIVTRRIPALFHWERTSSPTTASGVRGARKVRVGPPTRVSSLGPLNCKPRSGTCFLNILGRKRVPVALLPSSK